MSFANSINTVEGGTHLIGFRSALTRTLNTYATKHDLLKNAQVGISGSTKVGSHVMIGGQAGLSGHIEVGDRLMIAARSGLNRSLPGDQVVSGAPAMPHETWVLAQGVIPRLPQMRATLRELQKRVAELEARLGERE